MRLANKYRPRRFSELCGQRATRAVLHAMASRGTVPPALLFYGAFGAGKTTSARILAAALNCHASPGSAASWPCGECPSCKSVANDSSLDVLEVDAASNGTVDKVREILDLVDYDSPGNWRVVILDEAQMLSPAAANALLKKLEEPPPRTVFILCTTEHDKIPATVRSRCSPFAFSRLPSDVIAARLRHIADVEGIEADADLLAHLADRSQGAMRDAIGYLEQAKSVGIRSLRAWRELTLENDFAPALLAAAAQGNHVRAYEELDKALLTCSDYAGLTRQLVSCLRDVLVLGAGGEVHAQGAALEGRRLLAHNVDARRVVRAMGVLWDLQVKYQTADRRSGLELAVAQLAERLCPPAPSAANGNGHAPVPVVTAEFMASMEGFRA